MLAAYVSALGDLQARAHQQGREHLLLHGFPSISFLISWVNTPEPWLCPISTTPRP